MTASIMQPHAYPWLGYFGLMASVEKFVFLDDVKLEKASWQTRNRIKANGEYEFLTIPVRADSHTKIMRAELIPTDHWKEKHLAIIWANYHKAPYFEQIYPCLEIWLNYDTNLLSDMTIQIAVRIARRIGIQTAFYKTSELVEAGYSFDGLKDERIANICEDIYCDTYISPCGSANYIESQIPGGAFAKHGIKLLYQNFVCEPYPQQGDTFLPFCSIIDLLMNVGFDHALSYIKAGIKKPYGYLEYRKEILKLEEK